MSVVSGASSLFSLFCFAEVKPIPYRQTLAHVNNFIINTTQFLNRFSYLCEEKLRRVSRQIQQLDVMLSILEAKLKFIPGIENAPMPDMPDAPAAVSGGQSSVTPGSTAVPITSSSNVAPVAPEAHSTPSAPLSTDIATAEVVDEAEEADEGLPSLRNDPRYAKYFKMLDLGGVMAQVQQRMVMDGSIPQF